MQNVGAPTSLDTNLNIASSEVELQTSDQPLLRKALSDNFCLSLDESEQQEQLDRIQDLSDKPQPSSSPVAELSPKSKTRSRFSSAFRSFRASKSAKKKLSTTPTSSTDQVLSSGGEDLELSPPLDSPTDSKKKKSKLSKKFSLTGIKKNKVNPNIKKEEESNLPLVTSSTQTTLTLDRKPIFTTDNNESKRTVTVTSSSPEPVTRSPTYSPESSPTKFDKVRKIQITIQGKKIEHKNNNVNNNNNTNGTQQSRKNLPTTPTEIGGSSATSPNTDEGDYLTATSEDPKQQQQKPSLTTTTPLKKNSKKSKKTKSKPNSPTSSSPPASPSANKSFTSTISTTTTTTEEKLIVTQSVCDTPPSERAPAKPSRAPFASYSSTTVTPLPAAAAVAESPTGSASVLRKSISTQLPKLRRQRLNAFESADSESYFMIREGTVERGRRFPRPISVESQELSAPPIIAQSAAPTLPTPLGLPETNPKLTSPTTTPPPQSTTIANEETNVKSLPSSPTLSTEETSQAPHETINQKQRKIIISLPSFASTTSIGSGLGENFSPIPETESAESSPIRLYVDKNLSDSHQPKLSEIISENSIEKTHSRNRERETENQNEKENESHENFNQKKRKIVSLPSFASTSSLEGESLLADGDNIYFAGNNIQNPNLGRLHHQDRFDSIEDSRSGSLEEEIPIICDHRHNTRSGVGTTVPPQRTVIPLSKLVLESKDFSSFESYDQSPPGDLTTQQRRKLGNIYQSTVYSEEGRDSLIGSKSVVESIDGGSTVSKKDALNHIPGASEYSFESEFSVASENPMPAFGDLTMDQENPNHNKTHKNIEHTKDHSSNEKYEEYYDSHSNHNHEPIMTSSQEKREHLYKILVIGELGTGKTSFIKRYVHQFFSQNYRATIGVDFALKVLNWDSNTIVRLQLWDIAGQERFGNMTRVYYKEAVGAFIVFDVTRSGTFDCVSKWKEDLDSKVQLPDGSPIPCILLANKCDQDKQGIITTPEKMDEYVKENGFAGWFETSAKENINIDEAARALVNKILLNDKLISDADIADSEKFNLASSNGGQTTTQAIKSKCSC